MLGNKINDISGKLQALKDDTSDALCTTADILKSISAFVEFGLDELIESLDELEDEVGELEEKLEKLEGLDKEK